MGEQNRTTATPLVGEAVKWLQRHAAEVEATMAAEGTVTISRRRYGAPGLYVKLSKGYATADAPHDAPQRRT